MSLENEFIRLSEDKFSEVEENLSSISEDLMLLKENKEFLSNLFAVQAGQWVGLPPLCKGLTEIEKQLEEVEKFFRGSVQVTWLPYSSDYYTQGYCTIVFFVEDMTWTHISFYNKKLFLQNRDKHSNAKVDKNSDL